MATVADALAGFHGDAGLVERGVQEAATKAAAGDAMGSGVARRHRPAGFGASDLDLADGLRAGRVPSVDLAGPFPEGGGLVEGLAAHRDVEPSHEARMKDGLKYAVGVGDGIR